MLMHGFWLGIGLLLLLAATVGGNEDTLKYRWVWGMPRLTDPDCIENIHALMRRAKAAGYNGIVLAGSSYSDMEHLEAHHAEGLRKVQQAVEQEAAQLGLDLIPTMFVSGYAGGLMAYDPNLLEGLPVREALFVMQEGQAHPVT